MTCEGRFEAIDDMVDGRLSADQAAQLEAHAAGCPACREELGFVRELRSEAAALPRERQPEHDLWPGIEARLVRPGWYARPAWLAVAAVLLVAATAWVTLRLARPGADDTRVARLPALAQPVSGEAPGTVAGAEAEYRRAAAQLLQALEDRRDRLAPETIEQVQRNLDGIDAAMSEIRQAMIEDPGNSGLVQLLASAHRKKLQVLQTVVRHSTSL